MVVLDGATALAPGVPPAERYVDELLDVIRTDLAATADLRSVIAGAIGTVTRRLDLAPGAGPSSTVAILRWTGSAVEAAVLGDTTIILGTRDGHEVRLCDDRLESIATAQRRTYRERLERGSGYDDTHRQLLADVQDSERSARNAEHGYWIAEAVTDAGHHAELRRYEASDLLWAAIATDGAQRTVDHLHLPWSELAGKSEAQLADLLDDLQRWEALHDPDGQALPRAKRHDDKTIATWVADRH